VIRDFCWLSEAQFARLKPLLPSDTRGKPRVDDRGVISGIVHVLKSGGRWIDAPAVYGPRKMLYNRFVRWAARKACGSISFVLASASGPYASVKATRYAVLVDCSITQPQRRCSAGASSKAGVRGCAWLDDPASGRACRRAGVRDLHRAAERRLAGRWIIQTGNVPLAEKVSVALPRTHSEEYA
jgi:transposase